MVKGEVVKADCELMNHVTMIVLLDSYLVYIFHNRQQSPKGMSLCIKITILKCSFSNDTKVNESAHCILPTESKRLTQSRYYNIEVSMTQT